MEKLTFVIPTLLGVEGLTANELRRMNMEGVRVENGRVFCQGGPQDIARLNLQLRTGERVLILLGTFPAQTFEDLFQGTRALPWDNFIPKDGAFPVKGFSLNSALHSIPACQSIVKKAIVERLKTYYEVNWFEETGASYPLRVFLNKDEVTIGIDTSGESLHKRGYRVLSSKAPITETLAAAMILLTPWKADRILVDPFCGSGTIPIEAAMIAANIAPGMNRTFTAQTWTNLIPKELWDDCFEEAKEMVNTDIETNIQGYDIDGEIIRAARDNAKRAGVDHLIHFQQRPVSELKNPKKYGFVITNPPYGERLEEKAALPKLYHEIGEAFAGLDCWSEYLITSYEDTERSIGKKADKKRKIYNGMLRTNLYQYIGPKPPRRKKTEA